MRTVVIWDMCGQEQIRYFIVDRDLSHLHNLYINTYVEGKDKTAKQKAKNLQELSSLVYDDQGHLLVQLQDTFPVDEVKAGAQVIVCGFLP